MPLQLFVMLLYAILLAFENTFIPAYKSVGQDEPEFLTVNPSIVIPSAYNVITSPLPPPSIMQLSEPFSDFIVSFLLTTTFS